MRSHSITPDCHSRLASFSSRPIMTRISMVVCAAARREDDMTDKIYEVPADVAKRALVDAGRYAKMYAASLADPNAFWGEHARRIDWMKPFTKVKNTSFGPGSVSIKWFEDGTTNVAHNCIDRHLDKRGDQVAIIFEGDDPKHDAKITYRELHEH